MKEDGDGGPMVVLRVRVMFRCINPGTEIQGGGSFWKLQLSFPLALAMRL